MGYNSNIKYYIALFPYQLIFPLILHNYCIKKNNTVPKTLLLIIDTYKISHEENLRNFQWENVKC